MSKQSFDLPQFMEALKAVLGFALPDENTVTEIKKNVRSHRAILSAIRHAIDQLSKLETMVEEIALPSFVFSVSNPFVLGEVIAYKLEQGEKIPLDSIRKFYGSGVYSFYYQGSLPVYKAICASNCPIYVGSAGPQIHNADNPRLQGTKLWGRINEHLSKSILKSRNLQPSDFRCRFLVVQSGFEKAAEDFLIKMYMPVWNKESGVCAGVGKHGDKARQELSDWDVLHGARGWTLNQSSRTGMTPEVIQKNIERHFIALLQRDLNRWKKIFNPSWVREQKT